MPDFSYRMIVDLTVSAPDEATSLKAAGRVAREIPQDEATGEDGFGGKWTVEFGDVRLQKVLGKRGKK